MGITINSEKENEKKRKRKRKRRRKNKEEEEDVDSTKDKVAPTAVKEKEELEKEKGEKTTENKQIKIKREQASDDSSSEDDEEEEIVNSSKKRKKSSSSTNEKKEANNDWTVFVEGIPYESTEEEVKEFFISGGCKDILELRLARWQDTGRLRGFGHVDFASQEGYQSALASNGRHLGKRYLNVVPATSSNNNNNNGSAGATTRPQPKGCSIIFIKNLSYDATEDDLQKAIMEAECGPIVDGGVRISRHFSSRQSKGFAHVQFQHASSAQRAIQRAAKGDWKILGRAIYCDYGEKGHVRQSFRTDDGQLWSKTHKNTNYNYNNRG